MKVNRNQFIEDGYLVLREVVPPEALDALRESYELMVSRQREIWSKERGASPPSGSADSLNGSYVRCGRERTGDELTTIG